MAASIHLCALHMITKLKILSLFQFCISEYSPMCLTLGIIRKFHQLSSVNLTNERANGGPYGSRRS